MKENYLILIAVPVESKEHDLSIIWEHGGQIDGYKKTRVQAKLQEGWSYLQQNHSLRN